MHKTAGCSPPMVQNHSLPFLKETASFPRPAVKAPTIYLNPTEKDLPRFPPTNHDTKPPAVSLPIVQNPSYAGRTLSTPHKKSSTRRMPALFLCYRKPKRIPSTAPCLPACSEVAVFIFLPAVPFRTILAGERTLCFLSFLHF